MPAGVVGAFHQVRDFSHHRMFCCADLESLPRRELQRLAKTHGIKANAKSVTLIAELTAIYASSAQVDPAANEVEAEATATAAGAAAEAAGRAEAAKAAADAEAAAAKAAADAEAAAAARAEAEAAARAEAQRLAQEAAATPSAFDANTEAGQQVLAEVQRRCAARGVAPGSVSGAARGASSIPKLSGSAAPRSATAARFDKVHNTARAKGATLKEDKVRASRPLRRARQ